MRNFTFTGFLFSLLVVSLLVSCEKDDNSSRIDNVDITIVAFKSVFDAEYYDRTGRQNRYEGWLWKNGVESVFLSKDSNEDLIGVTKIVMSGNDIYFIEGDNTIGADRPWDCRVWKNGTPLFAYPSGYYVSEIFVIGSDVYAVASPPGNGYYMPPVELWKNDERGAVLGDYYPYNMRISVLGGETCVLINSHPPFRVWKNGQISILQGEEVAAIFGDIYSWASLGNSDSWHGLGNSAKIYKNDTELGDITGSSYISSISGMVTIGNDWYVSGILKDEYYGRESGYILWKNGIPTRYEHYVGLLRACGDDLYFLSGGALWKNGRKVAENPSFNPSKAVFLQVKPKS